MAITGGMKFFNKNILDIDNEACVVGVSTGGDVRASMRDRRRHTRWESIGSDDSTQETITVEFGSEESVNRILLVNNNFKAFTVKYWNGSAWTHFSNVVTKEGTQSNITETVNTKTTNYYEVDTVSTDKLQLIVDTTQTADAEKYLYEFIATSEIGTFTGFPGYSAQFVRNQVKKNSVRGRPKFTVMDEQYTAQLSFINYPTAADHAIVLSLWESLQEFLIYPCGGDAAQFRFSMIGNRLQDIFLVGIEGDLDPAYTQNVYQLGLNYNLKLVEVD